MSRLEMKYTHPEFQQDRHAQEKLDKFNRELERKESRVYTRNGWMKTLLGWWYLTFLPWKAMFSSRYGRRPYLKDDGYVNLLDKKEDKKYKTGSMLPLVLLAIDCSVCLTMIFIYAAAESIGKTSSFKAFIGAVPGMFTSPDTGVLMIVMIFVFVMLFVMAFGFILCIALFISSTLGVKKEMRWEARVSNYAPDETGNLRIKEMEYKRDIESVDEDLLRRKQHEFEVYKEQMTAIERFEKNKTASAQDK